MGLQMSLRSPLGQVLGLGSARAGSQHWWSQRVSAVALLPLTVWFLVSMLTLGSAEYAPVLAFLAKPFNGFLCILLVAALAYHSYLGCNVIVEDYVRTPARKIAGLLALKFAHVLAGGAAVFAVLRIVFGNHLS
jgi:succinate dehydrogenase / fumarate reductase membrane anchor subunit